MKLKNKATGETGYLELEKGDNEKYIGFRVYKNDFVYKRYGSLIDLSAEWEDYTPKEPRIENEEVRKAIRVWAEACGVRMIVFYRFGEESEFWSKDKDVSISFNCPLKLEDNGTYTLDELCGEEE